MTTRHLFDRRQAILGMGAALMILSAKQAVASDGDFAARLAEMQRDGRVSGLDALLVSRRGRLLFEYYGEGEAENWGTPLGKVTFGPTVLHDLRSVTKSLVGMLYGIALADGKVPPPEARLYEQFPEYPDLAKQPGRDRITVAHALSMTMGTEWDELTHPYGDPRNSENAMEAAPDRYRYILSLPIVEAPGVKWTYCGGATALLGHLIARGTGEKLVDYARRALFDPLGLGPVEWSTDAKGEPHAASGGRMRRVMVAADAPSRMTEDSLMNLSVRNSAGQMVPLTSVASLHWTTGPTVLTRYNGSPSLDVSGRPANGVSSGAAMAEMERLAECAVKRP